MNKAYGSAEDGAMAKTLYQATNLASGTGAVKNGVTWTEDVNQTLVDGEATKKGRMVYSNAATPLLKHFMKRISINRQYEYDGTTHNLITTDVTNLYGGAFFTDGKGVNVYTNGMGTISNYDPSKWKVKSGTTKKEDIDGIATVYYYDNASMWSPQHGYYIDKNAAVIIVPREFQGRNIYDTCRLVRGEARGGACSGCCRGRSSCHGR